MKKILNEMKLTLPAISENESYARYALSSFAAQLDPTLEEIADIRTVVSEAVTNAIIHGYRNAEGNVYIADAGNNRIIVLDRYYKVKFTISDFINSNNPILCCKVSIKRRWRTTSLYMAKVNNPTL